MNIKQKANLLAVLLMLVSCQQEKMPEAGYSDSAIIFTSDYLLSRSVAKTTFSQGDKVGVLGYCLDEKEMYGESDWNTKKLFVKPDVFYNQELTFDGAGLWEYDYNNQGLRKWYDNPKYQYSFFAYYPYASVSRYNNQGTITIGGKNMGTIQLSSEDAVSDPVLTYTMPHQGYESGTALDRTQTPDLMVAYNIDRTSGEGPVKMDFRHLLCGMEFEVNNFTEQNVEITKLQFCGNGFYKTIKVTGQNQGTEMGTSYYGGDFTIVNTNTPVSCEANGKLRIADADLLLIADENGNITGGSGSSSIKITYGGSNRTFPLSGLKFQAGVKNVFSINFIGNDVVLEMRATDNWEDGGDSDIVFE